MQLEATTGVASNLVVCLTAALVTSAGVITRGRKQERILPWMISGGTAADGTWYPRGPSRTVAQYDCTRRTSWNNFSDSCPKLPVLETRLQNLSSAAAFTKFVIFPASSMLELARWHSHNISSMCDVKVSSLNCALVESR